MATSGVSPSRPQQPKRAVASPVFICSHHAIKAAVWRNETENGVVYNTAVSRAYKEGDTWLESTRFGYDDVLIVAELLRICYGFISCELSKEQREAR
jgi:hypothetical protein